VLLLQYNMDNEEIPYRTAIPSQTPPATSSYSKDEEQQSTLVIVYKLLQESLDNLDKWSAFDLTESELKLKQQIKAHQLAYGIVSPLAQSVRDALSLVDDKYKQRNLR
jgi:hypothetical protein